MDITIFASIWPETVEGWCILISVMAGLIGSIFALIPVGIKLVRTIRELAKNKNWDKIKQIAKAAIIKAEDSGKAGADKKEMVIQAVAAGCKEAGIEVDDEMFNQLNEYIDKTIEFYNNMKKAGGKK